MTEAAVELVHRHSTPKRVVLAVVGLCATIWPLWDLWPAIVPISAVSPVFLVIVLGAAGIGLALLAASLFGDSTVLTIGPEGVFVERENLLRQRLDRLDPKDIGPITVTAHEWSDGPKRWRVTVQVRGFKPVSSPDVPTAAEAEAIAAGLARALG
jgi:hypothetical protein